MKKHYIICTLLPLAALAASCQSDNENEPMLPESTAPVFSSKSISFTNGVDTPSELCSEITVDSDNWTLKEISMNSGSVVEVNTPASKPFSIQKDWIRATYADGTLSLTVYTDVAICMLPEDTYESEADLVITHESGTDTITCNITHDTECVRLFPVIDFYVTPENITIPAHGGRAVCNSACPWWGFTALSFNGEPALPLPEIYPNEVTDLHYDWLRIYRPGDYSKEFTITAEPNTTGIERTAEISILYVYGANPVKVRQLAE